MRHPSTEPCTPSVPTGSAISCNRTPDRPDCSPRSRPPPTWPRSSYWPRSCTCPTSVPPCPDAPDQLQRKAINKPVNFGDKWRSSVVAAPTMGSGMSAG
ncbi:hypothetical protein ACFFX0_31630 [Citricoccus parietis]|uniref:Uncharacterized protein n=1 Tax=Citricoccus parietis TaxID=592307 RepID=A0ABV5G945_9MICC